MNAGRHLRLLKRINLIKPARLIKDLTNPLEVFDNYEFSARYRFDKDSFFVLFQLIEPSLMKPTDRGLPIPPLYCILKLFAILQLVHFNLCIRTYTVFRNIRNILF